jgi:hypothetical protein
MSVSGRVSVELWAFVTMMAWKYSSKYEHGFVRGRRGLSLLTTDAVAKQVLNIKRELTSSVGAKLPWEEGSVEDSIRRGNLYCLARKLAFSGRVSLLTTHVKQQRAWSASGWVSATRHNIYSFFMKFSVCHLSMCQINAKWHNVLMHINFIDWLIIYGFMSRSRMFHLYGDVTISGEGLQNLGLYSALTAFERGGIFTVPHLLWHSASVFPVSSEGSPHSVASYDTQRDVENLF